MHFTFLRPTIAAEIDTWASKDARMKHWLPAFNVLAGQAVLLSYGYGGKPKAQNGVGCEDGKNLQVAFEAAADRVALWRDGNWFKALLA